MSHTRPNWTKVNEHAFAEEAVREFERSIPPAPQPPPPPPPDSPINEFLNKVSAPKGKGKGK